MPRRWPQFPQPEMIVAKRANKCWSAGRNRSKTSPEYRRSRAGLIGRVLDVSSQGRYGGAKMDYLGALCMFVRAVEVGSFSKAAIATNTKTSTVSRAIASLEEDLGVSLFHRTTRRAHLTEPGATFYEHARDVLRGLEEARDAASAIEGRQKELIRLHVPGASARLHIMPFVPDFLAAYPDIRLDVSLTDVRVDLLSVGADLAIRIGPLIDSSLLARKLAPHRRIACASPAYLDRRPPIAEPIDLLQHNCLVYTLQPTDRWFFRHQVEVGDAFEQVPVTGTLRADDSEPLRDAAGGGGGGVLLPTSLVGEDIKAGRRPQPASRRS